jgi:hypothetical protein
VALAALVTAGALAGCEPYVEGNGVRGEEARDLPAFVGLSITDGIQAVVTASGTGQSVVVQGDENVLQYVETLVETRAGRGPVLVVRTASAYQSTNALVVLVRAPTFAYVAATEASPVAVTGAAAEVFTVEAADGSNVSLAGTGGARLALSLGGGQHGGARVDARDYPVAEADVAITAGAFATLRASGSVEGTADGAGSRVENAGAGACQVAATNLAVVSCAPQ